MSKNDIRSSFPKQIKVAGTNYQLRLIENLKGSSDTNCIGCFCRADGISLDPILFEHSDAGSVIANTLMHELMHALTYHYSAAKAPGDARKDAFNEEDMCEIVGNGFQQVMRDNPKLMKWLAKYA